MKNDGEVVKCPFCGRLYRMQSFSSADQSCCPLCQQEADETMREARKIKPFKIRKPWDIKRPWEADPYRERKDVIWRCEKPYTPPMFLS